MVMAQKRPRNLGHLETICVKPGGAALLTIEAPNSAIGCRVVQESGPSAVVHDNNPAHPKQQLWDRAAVKLIVEEGGGVYLDKSGRPYDEKSRGPIIIGANLNIAKEVIEKLRDYTVESGYSAS